MENSGLSKNMQENAVHEFLDNLIDLSDQINPRWYLPGIFQIICLPRNKAHFKQALNI